MRGSVADLLEAVGRRTLGVLRSVLGELANALTGNTLRRIERSLQETRQIAEENRQLLRSLHDTLKDQTLAAHLLNRLAEEDEQRRDET